MKAVYFHKAAKIEAIKAAEFYENHQKGLGKHFVTNLVASFQQIQMNPFMYPVIKLTLHRCRVHRFPYNVIFRIQKTRIEIIAIMHERQHPDYWNKRI